MFLLKCQKCYKSYDSCHFYFDFNEGNDFYKSSSKVTKQKMQRMNQWCNACKAAEYNLHCCSECLEFLPSFLFSDNELSKGIDNVCRQCKGELSLAPPTDSKSASQSVDANANATVKYSKPKAIHCCGFCSKSAAHLKCGRCRKVCYCNKVSQKLLLLYSIEMNHN